MSLFHKDYESFWQKGNGEGISMGYFTTNLKGSSYFREIKFILKPDLKDCVLLEN